MAARGSGGSVMVTAAVVNGAGDGDWLSLVVAGTCLGIREEDLTRIFTGLLREECAETRELEDNGPGLACGATLPRLRSACGCRADAGGAVLRARRAVVSCADR
jgi:hypothetical protein